MSKYGMVFRGSKSKIAEDVLRCLPPGKRLVDLFGGGFSITHCAMKKYYDKWDEFYYNDANSLLVPLIRDAISGKFSDISPEWVSREKFFSLNESDGFIRWVWSFSGEGFGYVYGKKVEEVHRKAHNFIVFGESSDISSGVLLSNSDIQTRRVEFWRQTGIRCQHLENLNQLSKLSEISALKSYTKLNALGNIDYRSYEYKSGDVVYCDIPYEDTQRIGFGLNDYCIEFNHDEFYSWAASQPFDVYYSNNTDSPGEIIGKKVIRCSLGKSGVDVFREERLYKL